MIRPYKVRSRQVFTKEERNESASVLGLAPDASGGRALTPRKGNQQRESFLSDTTAGTQGPKYKLFEAAR